MKLENIELSFDNFASEMSKLKNQKHFDYLVTIIGEDFGEEGYGCIYILENTDNNERCSVKTIAKKVDGSDVIPTVINLWKSAELLEREVFDFVGIKFLPTGGVNSGNIKEYIDAPFIHAVGGSWVCPKADIAAGNWDKITQLCIDARKAAKGE